MVEMGVVKIERGLCAQSVVEIPSKDCVIWGDRCGSGRWMSGIVIIVGLRVEVSDLGVMCPNVGQSALTGLRGA